MKGVSVRGVAGILAALALAVSTPCLGQPNLLPGAEGDGPQAAVERFLSLNATSALDGAEGRALLAGELEHTHRPTFGPLSPPDRIVMLIGGKAVARLPAQGEDRPDLYLYLSQRDGAWTLDGVRALALTGVPRELRRLLRALPHRTPDEEATLANVELVLASDRDLHTWFAHNRPDMEILRGMAQSRREAAGDGGLAISTPDSAALLQRLHLLALSVSRDGLVEVTIGGMVDNEVGFLHASDPASVPPIDPGDHIWIEPLGDGWYLFRTT
jgi:hypothetical protein